MKFTFKLPIRGKRNHPIEARFSTRKRATAPIEPDTQTGGSQPVGSNLFTTTLADQDFVWVGSNRASFWRYIRDHIPIISSSVWTWVHLCATPQSISLEGPEKQKKKADIILKALDLRILENPYIRQAAIPNLLEQLFLELFTVGKFACSYTVSSDNKQIDNITTHDTDFIVWKYDNGWKAYFVDKDDPRKQTLIPPDNFFWATLGSDRNNPAGIEPLASIPFLAQIQEALAHDMAKSSHNAGTPRLQIKITPPAAFPHESEKEYQKRINTYFDDTVEQFSELEADENCFTWQDIEIKVVGGEGVGNFAWRLNREQIIEDVITGLHLYPWALGRSHGTTKNWVESQFNLLMQVVDSVQNIGSGFANWIRNTELTLQGSSITSENTFAPNQDPFIVDKMNARATEFNTIDKKVQRGYISKDDGARMLGFEGAYNQDIEPTQKET